MTIVGENSGSLAGPILGQLQRILDSKEFDASDRNRRFLRYVVEEMLAGHSDRIKAYSVATSVFDRDESFDPQSDPIVRIEASRLRRSLDRIWGAGLEGSVASFPDAPEADVDVSFSDILKNLDMAGMVIAQLRYQRVAGYMDLIYTDVSADQETPLGILFDDVELESEVFIGTFGGAYRAIESEHGSLDLLAGVRVWSVDTLLKLEGGALADQEFEHNENWIDPIVGLHGRYQFENGLFLTNLVQVGGFGVGSDLTWDAFGGIGYQFNDSISAIAGYRHLEVDYEHNGFVFDVEMSGPVIVMTILF